MKLKIRRAVLDKESVFRARHERVVTEKDLRKKLKDRLKENNKKYYEWAEKVKENPDDRYKQGKCWEKRFNLDKKEVLGNER